MSEYNFELIFNLNSLEDSEQYIDALFEAGCDDGTLGTGKPGSLAITFTRESGSALDAVLSAVKDVKKAIPHAKLERAAPDLMNLTELAELLLCTKQNLQKYTTGKTKVREPFINPVVSGKTNYWNAYNAITWFQNNSDFKINNTTFQTVKMLHDVNRMIEKTKFEKIKHTPREMKSLSEITRISL